MERRRFCRLNYREYGLLQSQERQIRLIGAHNFRDLGGYRTADGGRLRWRRLFRSDSLHALTEDDLRQLDQMGLTIVLDLRTLDELERNRHPFGDGGRIRHQHLPFIESIDPAWLEDDENGLDGLYLRMLEHSHRAICTAFSILAVGKNYPAVFHCAAGKDRTGLLSALILRSVGVSDADIVTDYALTEGNMQARLEALRTQIPDERYRTVRPEMLTGTLTRTLAAFDERYGSTQAFLEACGIDQRQIRQLRSHLVEE